MGDKMGCDIHLYCEKMVYSEKCGNFWWCCDYFTLNPFYKCYENEIKYDHHSIWDERSYDAFGILANVRNSGHEIVLDEPRGLPKDVSDFVKTEADSWMPDGHSHSWFTAKELFAYDRKYPKSAIKKLVKKVKKKMCEEFPIWDFYSKAEKKELLEYYADDFRIVFWFDC